jgi:hypothetical protein
MHIEQCEPVWGEKRNAFRCPVSQPEHVALLRVGKKRQMRVQLLDESAGGFAVLADRHPGVQAGDVVRLCTESGWHEVRVVHVCKHRPAVAEGESLGESEGPQFRVGFERLRDLAPREGARCLRAWFGRLGIGRSLPLFSSAAVVVVVLLLSVTAALAAGAAILHQIVNSRPTSQSALSQLEEPISSSAPSRNADGPSQTMPTIARLPGASPFASKEVARELELSQSQQEEIGRIVDLSGEAVRQIPLRWPGQTREQHDEKRQILLDEARRRILQLLTEEQRDRWEALQGDADDQRSRR